MQPLQGITVVAVEQAVAAPFATRQLADLGARVIKIERPDGGDFARHYDATVNGLSSYFVWLNRTKESLTLDLKRPEGAGVLAQLLARADVFVQNLAPGAADRLGLSPAELRARHPGLIVAPLLRRRARPARTGRGRPIPDEPIAREESERALYRDRVDARPTVDGRRHRASRRRGHRVRAHQLRGGVPRASAARRARLLARHRLAGGALRATVPPLRMDGVQPALGDVPALGQHTDAILDELGIDHEAIATWRTEGVI